MVYLHALEQSRNKMGPSRDVMVAVESSSGRAVMTLGGCEDFDAGRHDSRRLVALGLRDRDRRITRAAVVSRSNGPESSGKTTLALHAIAERRERGGLPRSSIGARTRRGVTPAG